MRYSFMTYTVARQARGHAVDMMVLCRMARALGFDALDQVTLYDYEAGEIRRLADDHGLKIICYTFFVGVNTPAPAQRARAVDEFRRGLEVARVLGAPRVMLPIAGVAGQSRPAQQQQIIDGLREIVPLGQAAGITVTIEHFPGFESPFVTSPDLDVALAAVPGLKITFDSGNCLTGGENPVDAWRRHRSVIDFVHFKDWTRGDFDGRTMRDGHRYRPAVVGEGVVDYPALLRAMRVDGYPGHINLEYEGDDYPADEALRRALAYLRRVEESIT